MRAKRYVVITGSDEVDLEKIRVSKRVLSRIGVERGDPIELSVNGKKIALTVDYNSSDKDGGIEINNMLASVIGMNGRFVGEIRRLKTRELKKVVFKVKNSQKRLDINHISSSLLLRPVSLGSTVLVNSTSGMFELEVEECAPEEGVISTNTYIVFS